MFRLHSTLVGNPTYPQWCTPTDASSATGVNVCQRPLSALRFFYGDALYNPSSVDMTVFQIADFGTISQIVMSLVSEIATGAGGAAAAMATIAIGPATLLATCGPSLPGCPI
eukprot:281853-Prymnesium_polylepis.1